MNDFKNDFFPFYLFFFQNNHPNLEGTHCADIFEECFFIVHGESRIKYPCDKKSLPGVAVGVGMPVAVVVALAVAVVLINS